MIVIAIIGVLAAVAVPAFMRYVAKSKTSEARNFVKKIYEGARSYYMDQNYTRDMTFNVLERQFPESAPSMAPADPTVCCEKCAPDASLWTDETWVVLHFSVDDPHYYAYTYISIAGASPTGTVLPPSFTARANGDLDCDGRWSTFEMYGTVDGAYGDGPGGSAGLFRQAELE